MHPFEVFKSEKSIAFSLKILVHLVAAFILIANVSLTYRLKNEGRLKSAQFKKSEPVQVENARTTQDLPPHGKKKGKGQAKLQGSGYSGFSDPGVWVSIASMYAVIAVFGSWIQHRKSSMALISPHLFPFNWIFTSDGAVGRIKIGTIQNLGHGPAFHITILLAADDCAKCINLVSGSANNAILFISPGEMKTIDYNCIFSWDRTENENRRQRLKLMLKYSDIQGNRYDTYFFLTVAMGKQPVLSGSAEELVSGLYLMRRRTRFRRKPFEWKEVFGVRNLN